MRIYTLFAGVNGAGKSTLYQTLNLNVIGERVNSDEILLENGGDWRNINDQINAMREATRRIEQYLKEGVSFNQETTLAGRSVVSVVKRAREQEFYIDLYYIGLESVDVAIERVNHRIEHGGHGVKEDVIRQRYNSSIVRLKEILPLCDRVSLYDNTESLQKVVEVIHGDIIYYSKQYQWCEKVIEDMKVYYSQSNSTVDELNKLAEDLHKSLK